MKTPRYFDRTEDAAKHVGLSVHAFRRLYTKGKKGPRRIQEGWRFHYAIADLDAWKAERDAQSAEQPRISAREAARYLGLSPAYLGRLRSEGRGPRFVRERRLIFYPIAELDAWNAPRAARAAKEAQRLLERAAKLRATASHLKQLAQRTASVSIEAFE
jgi:predicted DNA-binding transcriptional regulator AlpA